MSNKTNTRNSPEGNDNFLSVVDDDDQVIGRASRQRIHKQGLRHREVSVWVVNSQGEILFQRRSYYKDTAPGKWDTSAGGHVEEGEGYCQAALSELEEELGIVAEEGELKLIKKVKRDTITPDGKYNNVWRAIYLYQYNGDQPLRVNQQEISEIKFFSLAELRSLPLTIKEEFIPRLLSDEYFSLYEEMVKMVIDKE